jgi:(1->4)-alpha-D-glucan 1-alpha-D-glucosylmutase
MERYICIHGHFYQPPRENPWLEAIEYQDSAYPYHDWNERISAECYAPNTAARILDGAGRITSIVNNYSRISFNFGPTLLSWMEKHAPEVYHAILAADQESQRFFSGHGSALAQVYNHVIMPLANKRDKQTQIAWGIADFEHRFNRKPEGMWLAETAVDLETLECLAEQGIKFTLLAPGQASKVRLIGTEAWVDVNGGKIDPTTPYLQKLPSGRSIALFFYDGPVSRAVAFERLLHQGETFAHRLLGVFNEKRAWPQLVHIATDGESYGHHHRHGEMALAYALHYIETSKKAELINYGKFLEKHPPTHEVEIIENTSWSCGHGVERWRSNCGCNMGRGWQQQWRKPLRLALDWLRDQTAEPYEEQTKALVKDPWAARNDYIRVILDRAPENVNRFLQRHAIRELQPEDRIRLSKWLELQRQAQLMYTSCGWFFDEISGIETVQVIQYAARMIQLAQELFPCPDLEEKFLNHLAEARSNLPEHKDGKQVYLTMARPARVGWEQIFAHYAVSSLFEAYEPRMKLFSFLAERLDYRVQEAGKAKLVLGRAKLTYELTGESADLMFGVLHFGDHNVNGGVKPYQDEVAYRTLVKELSDAFAKADFPAIIRGIDRGFGEATYSLQSLFRDEQRKVMKRVLAHTLADAEAAYRRVYEQHLPTMRFLLHLHLPLPKAFQTVTEYLFNADLKWAFEEDDPQLDHMRHLLEEAKAWQVKLDTEGLAYKFTRTLERLADRWRQQPTDVETLRKLKAMVQLGRQLPFEVAFWKCQNVFFEIWREVCPRLEKPLRDREAEAVVWWDEFLALGEQLNIQTEELKKKIAALKATPTVAEVVERVMRENRIPSATYRFQFQHKFTFQDALALVPYLHDLGISDIYASPILKPRASSTHGYDTIDHTKLNPALGTLEDFEALARALQKRGMGLILDTVPNHMGINDPNNTWWQDVLENGANSTRAHFFDIDWHPVNPELKGKVLIPILEDQYGQVLESGKIRLLFEEGSFHFAYYEHRLPAAPRSYAVILKQPLDKLKALLGDTHEHVQELQSIITAIGYLPKREELPPEKLAERNREKEIVKKRLGALVQACPEIRSAIEETVQQINGKPGDAASFDLLHELLDQQAFRPAFWRVAAEEINYRRFFDINDLAAIRVEEPEVFAATHQFFFQLLADGWATGLRIDHPDGLWNPTQYFRQVQEEYIFQQVKAALPAAMQGENLRQEVLTVLSTLMEGKSRETTTWPLYVVAEKILCEGEWLPTDWAVHGTTGYDFLHAVNSMLVAADQRSAFDTIYQEFLGWNMDFSRLVNSAKKMIMLVAMASEIGALSHELDRLAERNRRYRDFTLNLLTFAVREIMGALRVYRTYITHPENIAVRDRLYLESAVAEAKRLNPRTSESLFDFLQDTLLLRNLSSFAPADQPRLLNWVMKFQQLTGPVTAKGVEDTAFYVYNRLISLNEVGGHPEQFGHSVSAFHRMNQERQQRWPHSMLATATHDTKRGEDVRARLAVLSEMPQEWQAALRRWGSLNLSKKDVVNGQPAPDRNDEYLLYQTLLGAMPFEPLTAQTLPPFRERIKQYMQKATCEAKVHTSWINPNREYDTAVQHFVERLLPEDLADPFLGEIQTFQQRLAYCGIWNSLTQAVLKLTCPGVPDIYQGCELWDLSLVDPDNRRLVEYSPRQTMLEGLSKQIEKGRGNLLFLTKELLRQAPDGRIKLFVLQRLLHLRRRLPELFTQGNYLPLEGTGPQAAHVCAFTRYTQEQALLVVVPRLPFTLLQGKMQPPLGPETWSDTHLSLGTEVIGRKYRHLFTEEVISLPDKKAPPALPLAVVLQHFPVAVLERIG